jgi:CubicO group peptidase (beta-lactamase class C family)
MKLSGAVLTLAFGCRATLEPAPARSIAELESQLEALRVRYHIAGLSAAIAKDQSVAWTRGFGLADIASNRSVSDSSVFQLASLTKPFAATVILQLVEEGKVSLDDPVSKYGITLPSQGTILVRHLLSHTSEGVPGTRYNYNGNRFGFLDSVIARGDGRSTAAAVEARIIQRLGLGLTAPNTGSPAFVASGKSRTDYTPRVATGYTWNTGAYAVTPYPTYFGSAAGLMSTAIDYAKFSMAIDHDLLLKPETKTLAFTPVRSPGGQAFPYGLGWFSTMYAGERIIWHYGYWTANSSLIVKVPSRGLSFVLLANTDGLSSPFPLGSGQLERSDFARLFLDAFLGKSPPPLP